MIPTRIRIPDPSLVLLIGPSGAGKSTFAARHFQPTEVVSSDRCRALISDDESDQSINHLAFALLHTIARSRLSMRKLTVIDATNLQFHARRPLLRMARAYSLPAIALVFKTSYETCLTHNRARPNRFVLEEVIAKQEGELALAINRLDREGYKSVYWLDEIKMEDAVIEKIGLELSEDLSREY